MGRRAVRTAFFVAVVSALTFVQSVPLRADDRLTKAELFIPGVDVPLFDQAGPDRQEVRVVPAGEFPDQVLFLGTEVSAGRMHQIRLVPDGPAYWVEGTLVQLPEQEGEVKILCDANQVARPGDVGRGVGARTVCVPKGGN